MILIYGVTGYTGQQGQDRRARRAPCSPRAVLDGRAVPGFQTPSMAFGADFILLAPGCVRTNL